MLFVRVLVHELGPPKDLRKLRIQRDLSMRLVLIEHIVAWVDNGYVVPRFFGLEFGIAFVPSEADFKLELWEITITPYALP